MSLDFLARRGQVKRSERPAHVVDASPISPARFRHAVLRACEPRHRSRLPSDATSRLEAACTLVTLVRLARPISGRYGIRAPSKCRPRKSAGRLSDHDKPYQIRSPRLQHKRFVVCPSGSETELNVAHAARGLWCGEERMYAERFGSQQR